MPSSWTVVDPSLPALTFTYSFGQGTANALAVTIDGGGFAVVSPPCNVAESTFAELEARGPVRALVAPNAFHNLGLAPWKERYPSVPIFAPAQSIARLEKKTKLGGIQPLADAEAMVGSRVQLVDMPHYKTGEVLVRWPIDGGWAWYMTDVAMNITKRIPGLFGMVFRWSKSTPGFRRNALARFIMIQDSRALYAWLAAEAEKTPPRLVVMCHGEHVRPADPVSEVRAALA
jgi:hypothetical protein